jgi:hypothetical protein
MSGAEHPRPQVKNYNIEHGNEAGIHKGGTITLNMGMKQEFIKGEKWTHLIRFLPQL